MITEQQAKEHVKQKFAVSGKFQTHRVISLDPCDMSKECVLEDLGVPLLDAGWKCVHEYQWNVNQIESNVWSKGTLYVVEADPGPYVIEGD